MEALESNKRQQFGNRFLKNPEDVFHHNAWDNVEWDAAQEQLAKEVVEQNSAMKMSETESLKFEENADQFWDNFYDIHQNKFFKDRHWLLTEFPELAFTTRVEVEDASNSDMSANNKYSMQIFELGCGVGNTILPLLKHTKSENVFIYGCDFSHRAVEILQQSCEYDPKRCEVFVMDISSEKWKVPFPETSMDIIIMIFVLSAVHPDKMKYVIENSYRYLKPGGLILLRDYGRYDMAQLRFKPGKCLQDNFYIRGDGTRAYFFNQQEIKKLFESAGFIEEQNILDRRLQVNRGRMLKMYRIWIQAKYRKPK